MGRETLAKSIISIRSEDIRRVLSVSSCCSGCCDVPDASISSVKERTDRTPKEALGVKLRTPYFLFRKGFHFVIHFKFQKSKQSINHWHRFSAQLFVFHFIITSRNFLFTTSNTFYMLSSKRLPKL